MTGMEWFYIRGKSVKHAVRSRRGVAVCGIGPAWHDPDGWLGTGSQIEYETVASLRECRRCARILGGAR